MWDLSYTMRDLMSNPLMLSMFCSVIVPGGQSNNSFDQYEIYMKFMVKKHELYVSEKESRSYVSNRVLKQMLTNNIPFYNYVAIQEIVGEDKLSTILGLADKEAGLAEMIQKVSSMEKQNELLSFGVVVKDKSEFKFAHRTFAEFFYARLMTNIEKAPQELRNALFAFGYEVGNNMVAKFVSCVVDKNERTVQFLTKGWTKFVPEGEKLGRYVSMILCNHILSSTLEYGNCSRTVKLILRDVIEGGVFVPWLTNTTNEVLGLKCLLNETNTRILTALVFPVSLYNVRKNIYVVRELCYDVLVKRVSWMPLKELEVIAVDILRDIRQKPMMLDLRIFTWLASVFSREKLRYLIVNEETRVTDLIAYTRLKNISTFLEEEFLPTRLLKFRIKFGRKKGNSLFHHKFRKYSVERVWKEIEENVQEAVEVVQGDRDFEFIRQMENSLRRFKGCSELRESRRRLLIDILAKVDWTRTNLKPESSLFEDKYFNLIAYGKMELIKWEHFRIKEVIRLGLPERLSYVLGCLMLSALNEVTAQQQYGGDSLLWVPAPLDLVRKLVRWVDWNDSCFLFITDLSRELLVNLEKIKTEDPVLLSDLPSVWEVFFHADKGLIKANGQMAIKVLNENDVLETIVRGLLQFNDASISPEDELRRVFLNEGDSLVPKEHVKKAMNHVVPIVGERASDLWLKDVKMGKKYILGMFQLYLEIFKGKFDKWADKLIKKVPVQLLDIAKEKVLLRSGGGGPEWIKLLRRVNKFVRGHFRDALSLNGICFHEREFPRYNRECDWYTFFVVMLYGSPEMKEKIPQDYANEILNRTKVYLTWECSLLRACIRLFGVDETRRQADKIPENGSGFWESAREEMKDGELLHIAVELGSLAGVKWTAYPTTVQWRNGNNRSAVEYAEETLGKGHEVTQYLERVVGNMTQSGFLTEVTY